MVGRLNLPNVCEGDPLEMSCKAERGLDSPDSGLPPSPSPSAWMPHVSTVSPVGEYQPGAVRDKPGAVIPVSEDQPGAVRDKPGAVIPVSEDGGPGSLVPSLSIGSFPQLQLLSYGEGISLDPLPPKEMRYTSSLRYDSSRHFIQDVTLRPWGQRLERCSQTVTATPHSTWRRYKTQLEFQPLHRVQRFQSTTIIYPKHAWTVYTTELSYDCHRRAKRFLSSVELEAAGRRKRPQ